MEEIKKIKKRKERGSFPTFLGLKEWEKGKVHCQISRAQLIGNGIHSVKTYNLCLICWALFFILCTD